MTLTSPLFLSLFLPLYAAGFLGFKKSGFRCAFLLIFSGAFYFLNANYAAWTWVLPPLLILLCPLCARMARSGAQIYTALALLTMAALKFLPLGAWPMGLSFIALQGIMYVHEQAGRKNPLTHALLYTAFFPKIAAGPLCHYEDFDRALTAARPDKNSLYDGLFLFIIGLSKKLLLASWLYPLAQGAFSGAAHPVALGFALVACPLYVYMDFSGYTDMARGLAGMMDIALPQNFNSPFHALSIRDFWRRWHITLSSFFRDYVYIPLGGSKKGKARTVRNVLCVYVLMGLWHGATQNYLLFALWHALFLILEHLNILHPKQFPRFFSHAYTLAIVAIGFVIFLAPANSALPTLSCSESALKTALGMLSPLSLIALVASICMIAARFAQRLERAPLILKSVLMLSLVILCYMAALSSGDMPFLYAQF